MREILFRGKSLKTEKWIQGYLFQCWERAYIAWGMVNDNADMKEVFPETVCQYTGLTDKNGRKIFEGDIVRNQSKWDENIGVIRFQNTGFSVDWKIRNKYSDKGISCRTDDVNQFDEVTGNIFDNSVRIWEES